LRNGRIPGVLQRFAMSYGVVALIILFVPKLPKFHVVPPSARDGVTSPPPLAQGRGNISLRTAEQVASLSSGTRRFLSWMIDVAPYLYEWAVIAVLVIAHCCITFLMPVPGCPTGKVPSLPLHEPLLLTSSSYLNPVTDWQVTLALVENWPSTDVLLRQRVNNAAKMCFAAKVELVGTLIGRSLGGVTSMGNLQAKM
jgi:hypothetical protein